MHLSLSRDARITRPATPLRVACPRTRPRSRAAAMASDTAWLYDYLMQMFKSPTFEVPIMNFIDEKRAW